MLYVLLYLLIGILLAIGFIYLFVRIEGEEVLEFRGKDLAIISFLILIWPLSLILGCVILYKEYENKVVLKIKLNKKKEEE